jgi:hypothetical protein
MVKTVGAEIGQRLTELALEAAGAYRPNSEFGGHYT